MTSLQKKGKREPLSDLCHLNAGQHDNELCIHHFLPLHSIKQLVGLNVQPSLLNPSLILPILCKSNSPLPKQHFYWPISPLHLICIFQIAISTSTIWADSKKMCLRRRVRYHCPCKGWESVIRCSKAVDERVKECENSKKRKYATFRQNTICP